MFNLHWKDMRQLITVENAWRHWRKHFPFTDSCIFIHPHYLLQLNANFSEKVVTKCPLYIPIHVKYTPRQNNKKKSTLTKNVFDLRVTERTHLLNNRTQIIIKFGQWLILHQYFVSLVLKRSICVRKILEVSVWC